MQLNRRDVWSTGWRSRFQAVPMASLCGCAILVMALSVLAGSFRDEQMRFPRVRAANARVRPVVDSIYKALSVNPDSLAVFLRVHKHEREVELWLGHPDTPLRLAKTYRFTAFSGVLGPKRARGDLQIPEGVYHIDRFNPTSSYHLSLGINYPNRSDRIRATGASPGADIFIHGNRVTIGCIPLGDSVIEELYVVCVDAKSAGQLRIPVHMFPCKMLSPRGMILMGKYRRVKPDLYSFWEELKTIYINFQNRHRVPAVQIDRAGRYCMND